MVGEGRIQVFYEYGRYAEVARQMPPGAKIAFEVSVSAYAVFKPLRDLA